MVFHAGLKVQQDQILAGRSEEESVSKMLYNIDLTQLFEVIGLGYPFLTRIDWKLVFSLDASAVPATLYAFYIVPSRDGRMSLVTLQTLLCSLSASSL